MICPSGPGTRIIPPGSEREREQSDPSAKPVGSKRKKDAHYLDACRAKRNIVEYDYVGSVTQNDADELIVFAKYLKDEVETWLEEKHPELA